MKKTKASKKVKTNDKGFLELAGEAFSVLGAEIVEGKDKLVEVASEKIEGIKKTIKNLTKKKIATKKVPLKKVARKAATKKTAVKSAAKKAGVKKPISKKAVAKKAASKEKK